MGIFRLAADADEMKYIKNNFNTGQYDVKKKTNKEKSFFFSWVGLLSLVAWLLGCLVAWLFGCLVCGEMNR